MQIGGLFALEPPMGLPWILYLWWGVMARNWLDATPVRSPVRRNSEEATAKAEGPQAVQQTEYG